MQRHSYRFTYFSKAEPIIRRRQCRMIVLFGPWNQFLRIIALKLTFRSDSVPSSLQCQILMAISRFIDLKIFKIYPHCRFMGNKTYATFLCPCSWPWPWLWPLPWPWPWLWSGTGTLTQTRTGTGTWTLTWIWTQTWILIRTWTSTSTKMNMNTNMNTTVNTYTYMNTYVHWHVNVINAHKNIVLIYVHVHLCGNYRFITFKKIGFDPDNCFIKDLDFDRFIASKILD